METGDITFADLDEAHLDDALALSREAGWPHRRQDWEMVLALSNGVAALDGTRLLGTALSTPFGTDVATINMVIVAAAARGRGLGRKLMEAALDHCRGRECRLIATEDGLPLYEKLGFKAVGTIRQHQGVPSGTEVPTGDIAEAAADDIPMLVEMDRRACGMERGDLITRLARPGRIAVLKQDGGISGFAGLRTFGRGEVVGPVVATSDNDARDLLSFMFAARSGSFIRVDIPETSGLAPWLTAHGLLQGGGGIAMRRDAKPGTPPETRFRTYALASQALG